MYKTSELRDKEVINIDTGEKLGNMIDIEVNFEEGCIEGFVLPGERNAFRLFSKNTELYIPWSAVKKIGSDVILIEIKERTIKV
ncbi:YlmC/YmxH family sporulation protein [Aceticella autotrophica]|uniref:YlmC/YmxH family sporulation protein n=1 Tax=Aceticella autotrophica TaxID=2755338 RepID=A0A975AWT7_9THEO|nr:YlmC/YmxH family sporulation protein [Aceticella autotrophica]QSZ27932.1 YlmC/YmxH family sporulation protein [Aceticella autotrophica]